MVGASQWLPTLLLSFPVVTLFMLNNSAPQVIRERRRRSSRKFPLKPGRSYVVRERTPDHIFWVFSEAMRGGQTGLVVSRNNPTILREDFKLSETRILWLTEAVGEDRVSPTDPAALVDLVRSFADLRREVVVALVGVEYLSGHIGSEETVRTLESLRDAVTGVGGTFLVSLDDAAVNEALLSFFDREFETLPSPPPKGYTVADVFVIDAAGGILIGHVARRSRVEIDADVMAGMLTVIMDFAKVSFAEGFDQLRGLELGDKRVVLERGDRLILAVVFAGREPAKLRAEMRAFAARLERRYGDLLDRWSGNMAEMRNLEAMTERVFMVEPIGASPLQ